MIYTCIYIYCIYVYIHCLGPCLYWFCHSRNIISPLPGQDRLSRRISSCENRMKKMQEEESDTEFAESVKIHLESWVNKKAFFEVLISMGLLPADVPADGNCALWSLCALEAGCFTQTKLCTAERIRGVRQDWVISSFNVSYVLLFVATNGYNIVCSEEDIPTSPETHILFFWNKVEPTHIIL